MYAQNTSVSVIGGAGHVGLPFCIVLASRGYTVHAVDRNAAAVAAIARCEMPFREDGAEALLSEVIASGRLRPTTDLSKANESDVVVVVIGTPIDENLNPDLGPFKRVLRDLVPFLRPGQLVVLRSTVSPETTALFRELLEAQTGLRVGRDLFLVFAPERVAQGRALREIVDLPQLVGAFDDASYAAAEKFFEVFLAKPCIRLAPTEAEIGKLITNMFRYVQFALANEFYLICQAYGLNAHHVMDACQKDYPRFSLPTPGPNVGGPCLYKDGFFLLERFPFNEIIAAAFRINEGMPMQIVQRLRRESGVRKVGVLGLTFKADCDDTRNSLSYKLKKQLESANYEIVLVDPFVPAAAPVSSLGGCDAVILMTPHRSFQDLQAIQEAVQNPDCLFVDLWGFWPQMRGRSAAGYFRSKEVRLAYASHG